MTMPTTAADLARDLLPKALHQNPVGATALFLRLVQSHGWGVPLTMAELDDAVNVIVTEMIPFITVSPATAYLLGDMADRLYSWTGPGSDKFESLTPFLRTIEAVLAHWTPTKDNAQELNMHTVLTLLVSWFETHSED